MNRCGEKSSTARQFAEGGPSNYGVEKKFSTTALSQQLPLWLMLCTASARFARFE
jgi:hypothetical protein